MYMQYLLRAVALVARIDVDLQNIVIFILAFTDGMYPLLQTFIRSLFSSFPKYMYSLSTILSI